MSESTATLPLPCGAPSARPLDLRVHQGADLAAQLPRLTAFAQRHEKMSLSRHPHWLAVLEQGLRHDVYCLEAVEQNRTYGILPLACVSSLLFGKFLVSLPYLNYSGVDTDDEETAGLLIDRACRLADELCVRYLELRHEQPFEHAKLTQKMASKVNMRLSLPTNSEVLWKQLSAKVRNQVRKGQKSGLTWSWGNHDVLPEFHRVFSTNMRDLGTPSYGKRFFASILSQFGERAEICLIRSGDVPVAGALLLHGVGITEVPSASSLRSYNHTCANMLMYWQLLERAVERKQSLFDFGRSSRDSNTYRFKEQWGATEAATEWQYYVRQGSIAAMRPESPRYRRMIRVWQRLPVALTRWLGPMIVRGIP